jgi:hypothetical protein
MSGVVIKAQSGATALGMPIKSQGQVLATPIITTHPPMFPHTISNGKKDALQQAQVDATMS